MSITFKILHSVILIVNVVVVLLLILSGYSYIVKPEHSIFLPLLCYLFPILALVNFSFILYWLLRFKIWILIPLIGFLITFDIHKAWFPIGFSDEGINENTFSILSYNVKYFEYPYDKDANKVHPAITYIQETDADIVCLQEVGNEFINDEMNKRAVKKALKAYPYIITGASEGRYSVVCLSKYPVIWFKRISYNSKSNSSFYYDLKIGDDTIRVINNHLESNKLNPKEKDKYSYALRHRESEDLTKLAEVLGSKVGSASSIRGYQAVAVSDLIKSSRYKVIVCGDFNDVPGSFTYRTIRKGLDDSWIENGFGWGNTFHDNLFLFRIDYILHSPEIECVNTKIDKYKFSDHYPLRANFIIK